MADLDPAYHDLTEADFQESYNVGSFAIGKDTMKLGEPDCRPQANLLRLHRSGIHAYHLYRRKRWIQQRIESVAGKASFTPEEKKRFLSELTAAEGLERYRRQIPGGEALLAGGWRRPDPDAQRDDPPCRQSGTREVVLGMAHRGRLNVLVNVLGKNRRTCSTSSRANIKNTSAPAT